MTSRRGDNTSGNGGVACCDNDMCGATCGWLKEEDVMFLFVAMTWSVDLLLVFLARAPNPLLHDDAHHHVRSHERPLCSVELAVDAMSSATPALPSLEETFLRTAKAQNVKGSDYHRRKRQKEGRDCATHSHDELEFFFEHSAPMDEEVRDGGENEEEESPEKEAETEDTCGMYLGGKEKSDVRCVHEAQDSFSGMTRATTKTRTTVAVATDLAFSTKTTKGQKEEKEQTVQASMRDFLRLFYQSFLIVVVAQMRHQPESSGGECLSRSLLPLEYRALCFVRRYLAVFKCILRRNVISGEREVERRGVQPLLVGDFACDEETNKTEGAPAHFQMYISGKQPVCQPLLLERLHITRVVQCYADTPLENARAATRGKDVLLNTLESWRKLLLEGHGDNAGNKHAVDVVGLLFVDSEERDRACTLFNTCLSPLVWTPYAPLGLYAMYTSQLPLSHRRIVKLVVPAEDRESYDLSQHFQESIFCFLHGAPLFPFDLTPNVRDDVVGEKATHCSLLHCSAGMHRSSGMAVAYFMWLAARPRGRFFAVRGTNATPSRERGPLRQQPVSSFLFDWASETDAHLSAVKMCSSSEAADADGGDGETVIAETMHKANDPAFVFERCAEHVRLQRTVAVPIPAVQEQLQLYASSLHLK